jgi:hypothetical protein
MTAKILNPEGRTVKEYPWWKPNSLLKQWAQALVTTFSNGVVSQNILDTGGTTRTIANPGITITAAANTTTDGIVVGTGTNAVTIADNKLQTQLTTNLYHQACIIGLERVTPNDLRILIHRIFNNNTGSDQTITEVGLYGLLATYHFCLERTRVNLMLPNTFGLFLAYRLGISV